MHKYGIVSCVVPDDQFAVIPRKFAFAYFDRVERVRLRDGSVAVDYSANEGVQQQQRLLQSANGSSFVAAYGHLSLAAYTGVRVPEVHTVLGGVRGRAFGGSAENTASASAGGGIPVRNQATRRHVDLATTAASASALG